MSLENNSSFSRMSSYSDQKSDSLVKPLKNDTANSTEVSVSDTNSSSTNVFSRMRSKVGTYVDEKKDALIKASKTESNEILERNTNRSNLGTDTLNTQIKPSSTNLANTVSFEPSNKLPENLRALYKDVSASLPPTEKSALEGLLKDNKLTMKDSKGKTVMENLSEIKNGSKQTGVRANELLKDAVLVLSDRKYITQGPHGTCGAGSIQNHLWVKDPAEMLRIVKDLAKSGECSLRDGTKLKAGTNSLKWHENDKTTDNSTEDRRDFNIIFQSAIMRDVALVGGDRAFGNAYIHDLADYNVNKDNSDGPSVSSGDSAANPQMVTPLLEGITGKKYSNSSSFVFGQGDRIEELDKASKQGKQPIALFSSSGYFGLHYVVVQKVENGNVFFQNTAKSKDYGGVDSMSVADFKSKVRGVILPD